jgi:autotransporter-associated beta strand protein
MKSFPDWRLFLMLVWLPGPAQAATHTWTGAVGSAWSVNANWTGNSPAGDPLPDLVFPAGASSLVSTDDIPGVVLVNTLQISGDGYQIGSLPGSSIELHGALVMTSSNPAISTIAVPIALDAAATPSIEADGFVTLRITSTISGTTSSGVLSFVGNGTVVLAADNTYTASTTIATTFSPPIPTGTPLTIVVDGSQQQSPVTLRQGVLGGKGTTGAVDVIGLNFGIAGLQPGDLTTPGTLNLQGDLQLSGGDFGDFVRVRINGASPGVDYDRVQVNGSAALVPGRSALKPRLRISLGFVPPIGQSFTILQSTGPLSGTFDVGPDGSVFRVDCTDLRINYTASSVVLTAVSPQGLDFYTVPPCRILDTRNLNGPLGGPALAPNSVRVFPIVGTCQIPSSATAVSFNVTITAPQSAGDLRLFPGGSTPPLASTINFRPGQTRANNANLRLACDGSGTVAVQNDGTGTVHLILDVDGYYQ